MVDKVVIGQLAGEALEKKSKSITEYLGANLKTQEGLYDEWQAGEADLVIHESVLRFIRDVAGFYEDFSDRVIEYSDMRPPFVMCERNWREFVECGRVLLKFEKLLDVVIEGKDCADRIRKNKDLAEVALEEEFGDRGEERQRNWLKYYDEVIEDEVLLIKKGSYELPKRKKEK